MFLHTVTHSLSDAGATLIVLIVIASSCACSVPCNATLCRHRCNCSHGSPKLDTSFLLPCRSSRPGIGGRRVLWGTRTNAKPSGSLQPPGRRSKRRLQPTRKTAGAELNCISCCSPSKAPHTEAGYCGVCFRQSVVADSTISPSPVPVYLSALRILFGSATGCSF